MLTSSSSCAESLQLTDAGTTKGVGSNYINLREWPHSAWSRWDGGAVPSILLGATVFAMNLGARRRFAAEPNLLLVPYCCQYTCARMRLHF